MKLSDFLKKEYKPKYKLLCSKCEFKIVKNE
jgi:hypothetical protein